MTEAPCPEQNHLLAEIPEHSKSRVFQSLRLVELKLGDVIYESDQPIEFVYFPTNCIISLLYVMRSGASAEISVIGNEGLVGVSVVLGGSSTPNRAIVQSSGYAYQMPVAELEQEFNASADLRVLTLRYTQALITQMSQTAVCNRHHSIDQQLCRWLLLSLDRLQGNQLDMTQELIANMLGVRREGVTEAARKLQKLGIIQYKRGHIKVIDRKRLEEMSCECYDVVKRETERLRYQKIGS
ncbi:Crp/Fnr family transcriptional regulator [Marinobacter sediminum]|uniref:Crp/Fnr family transcriptional regulator n=1 Tax=Marinobacter sediminum TaxID=256323 RepID=UPI00202F9ED4|nr:Crp/Fnr family transcriptional regulator [Marinobacter sediminum]MCM0613145.1 Crp/Fnr family transcriptional regulator [Marinobacter sediminum]